MVDTSTEAVAKLLDGVTPGPWVFDPRFSTIVAGEKCIAVVFTSDANAHFIASVRDLVPALLAERDAQAARADAADADVARRLEMHECAMAERDDCIEDWSRANDRIKALLAERDALRLEIENLRQIDRNVQAVREHEYKRADLVQSLIQAAHDLDRQYCDNDLGPSALAMGKLREAYMRLK